jgi:GT2 family glycosyltransferase
MSFPTFSVVIPTYNRVQSLPRCLDALDRLDYPRDCYEIIVVDDGGSQDLQPIIEQAGGQITLVRQSNSGPALARNTGVAHASGDFVAFTDDDCLPDQGWMRGFLDILQSMPNCLAGGRTVNHLVGNLASSASQHLQDYVYGYYNRDSLNARFFASNNMAMSRASYQEIGGFDATFGFSASEDRDLCDRWLLAGRPLCYAPDALIFHAHSMTIAGFWQQHFGYGKGAYHFHQRRAARHQAPIRIEPAAFYINMLRYPFGVESAPRALILSALMGLSQFASAAGFFTAKTRSGSHRS